MKIAVLSSFVVEGGAPIAAYRLHKGLHESGLDSHFIVKVKSVADPQVHPVVVPNLKSRMEEKAFFVLERQVNKYMRTELSNTYFSVPYPTLDLTEVELLQSADIINLHWVSKFLSVESIAGLLNMGKPVVWTLHDQNPFTGGCHYSAGCEKFQEDCSDCPQLKNDEFQLPFKVLKKKSQLWKQNLSIVTPSRWLADSARQSLVFRDLRIDVIPNSLETNIFIPTPKKQAKQELGLNPDAFALLLGAFTGFERRKGYSELLEALRICLRDERFKKMNQDGLIEILAFGPPQDDLKEFFMDVRSFGYVADAARLAKIYSAADAFLLPSREDNLPNTMLEAMACATPVLSFEVGGMPDMIENGKTGFMAPAFDSQKFGEQILKLAFAVDRDQMDQACRSLIEKKFKLLDQAQNYLGIFQDLLKSSQVSAARIIPATADNSGREEIQVESKGFFVPREFLPLYKQAYKKLLAEGKLKIYLRNLKSKVKAVFSRSIT